MNEAYPAVPLGCILPLVSSSRASWLENWSHRIPDVLPPFRLWVCVPSFSMVPTLGVSLGPATLHSIQDCSWSVSVRFRWLERGTFTGCCRCAMLLLVLGEQCVHEKRKRARACRLIAAIEPGSPIVQLQALESMDSAGRRSPKAFEHLDLDPRNGPESPLDLSGRCCSASHSYLLRCIPR